MRPRSMSAVPTEASATTPTPQPLGEDRFRLLAENASDIIYLYRIDPEPGFDYVSPSATRITGFTPQEHYADPELFVRIVHPHDRPMLLALLRAPSAFPDPMTLRFIRRDGRLVWTEHRVAAIYDANASAMAIEGIARDITERREAEEELWRTVRNLRDTDLQRRRLVGLLATTEQRERRRIAEDLHDDSIQVLTAAVLRLTVLRRHLPESVEEDMDQLEWTLRKALDRLRHLSFELRPPVLDTEGLAAAIELYLQRWDGDSPIGYEIANRLEREPPEDTRLIMYRIVQEALSNVAKHAAATQVNVVLEEAHGGYLARVHDDGKGFDGTTIPVSDASHLGMASMRERAELVGGWWRTRSAPGAGTTVEFWVPGPDVIESDGSPR